MQLDILAEYIKLTNKRIKFPWHKRRIADLRKQLELLLDLTKDIPEGVSNQEKEGGVAIDDKVPEYRGVVEYPYTADELRVDYEKRVYDGRAQRKPW